MAVTSDGLRMTPQRRAVLDVLLAAHDHPTAAEVWARVRTVRPGIGPATVYRTLALLVARGEARELTLADAGAARYDGNVTRHDHLVCDRCGRTADVAAALPVEALGELARAQGFELTGYDLQIHGRCARCAPPPDHPHPPRAEGEGETWPR